MTVLHASLRLTSLDGTRWPAPGGLWRRQAGRPSGVVENQLQLLVIQQALHVLIPDQQGVGQLQHLLHHLKQESVSRGPRTQTVQQAPTASTFVRAAYLLLAIKLRLVMMTQVDRDLRHMVDRDQVSQGA